MTTEVITAGPDTSYKELVRLLAEHRVSALPVVTAERRVVGIVSEADLLHKEEFQDAEGTHPLFERHQHRVARAKAASTTAGALMTSPAVTTGPHTPLAEAARLMVDRRVKQLPVADAGGRLVGIVSRGDVLGVFLRSDVDIRHEVVEDVLRDSLWVDVDRVTVTVDQGLVTLVGTVEQKSLLRIVERLVRGVDGVVSVVDRLEYEIDDTRRIPEPAGPYIDRP